MLRQGSAQVRWRQAKEPGLVQRLKRIAELLDQLRKQLIEQDIQRIERMAQAAHYFQEPAR